MKRLLILLLFFVPALALGKTWQMDQAQSTLGFEGSFQDQPFEGTFKDFDAVIHYDPSDLSTASFDVHISLTSVDTQSPERDQALAGSDFFDVTRYPKAHFVTRSFDKASNDKVIAHGTLTLHGISQPVDLEVDFKPGENGATLDVSTDLSRLDYKLGASDDWNDISRRIRVRGHLVLH